MKKINKNILISCIAACAAVVLIIALVLVESLNGDKLVIKNKTDKDISDIMVHFFDTVQDMEVDYLYKDEIPAGKKIVYRYDGYYDFTDLNCYFCADVKFDGMDDYFYLYDGEFTTPFRGTLEVTFYQKGDTYFCRLQAPEGIFRSTKASKMDTDFELFLEDADWDYVW